MHYINNLSVLRYSHTLKNVKIQNSVEFLLNKLYLQIRQFRLITQNNITTNGEYVN